MASFSKFMHKFMHVPVNYFAYKGLIYYIFELVGKREGMH